MSQTTATKPGETVPRIMNMKWSDKVNKIRIGHKPFLYHQTSLTWNRQGKGGKNEMKGRPAGKKRQERDDRETYREEEIRTR